MPGRQARIGRPGNAQNLRTGVLAAAVLLALVLLPGVARAQACATNPVACENALPANSARDAWKVAGAGDPSIQGFATAMSVDRGETISFKVKTDAPAYEIDVYRLGWYGGSGARRVAAGLQPTATLPQMQPSCDVQAGTGLIDCGNWAVSRTWTVPADAVSGVYVAHLVRPDTGVASNITFVVRDDARHADVLLSTSDATWQAYNDYGGNNLYACTVSCPPATAHAYRGASKVSYNRPFRTPEWNNGLPWMQNAELSMIHFLEANGYDVAYTSSVDVHSRGPLLRDHRVFVSSGQDEYWSGAQRANVEAARDAGVNLAFFSANEIYWKTRWEPSVAGTPSANRTLVAYKDTHYDAPVDPVEWTGTWQDPRFSPPGDGGRPQNALTGQVFSVNLGPGGAVFRGEIRVPAQYGSLRLWRNTAAATLPAGETLTLGNGTLDFEWDEDFDNGFRPAGSIRLSSTRYENVDIFTDYGSTEAFAPATHNLTMYRAPSGALVFGAGTMQWSWGLDPDNPGGYTPDRNMRQATVNLFADMGTQPATPLSGLAPASASSDSAKPSSTLSSPPATVADGRTVTLSGTATDAGGGVVAGVEVSTDDGATWHRADGTTSWTYRWTPHGNPAVIRTRATDDSANTEAPRPGTAVVVACPCSLWGTSTTPDVTDAGDTASVELGVRFRSDAAGSVTAIRFYKLAGNGGTHTGSLWTADGATRLATVTFTDESASGWQTATFANPVAIQPGKTYVASYFAPNGHYAATSSWFYPPPAPGPRGGATVDSPPLHAARTSGVAGATTNGVFSYGTVSRFPASSYNATNYWVDVVFGPPPPGIVTGVSAAADGANAATVSWSAPSGGPAPTSYEVTPRIAGAAQAATTVAGSPPAASVRIGGLAAGMTYTFSVRAFNGGAAGLESAPSNPVALLAAPLPDPSGGGGIGGSAASATSGAGAAPDRGSGGPGRIVAVRPANPVLATLKSARVRRLAGGRRVLRIVASLGETVTIAARLARGSRTLVTSSRTRVRRGLRTLDIAVPRRVAFGSAQLRLRFTDGTGAAKTVRRTLTVPHRGRQRDG